MAWLKQVLAWLCACLVVRVATKAPSPFALAADSSAADNKKISYKGVNYDDPNPECTGLGLFKGSFPDLDYALMGYDSLKGYPLAIGHDPGFTRPIFFADYTDGFQTADCLWSVPRGVMAVPDVSCVTSFSSSIVRSSRSLSKELKASVSVEGGGWGVEFSASAGFQEASSEMSSGKWVYLVSKAACDYYYTQLLEEDAKFDRLFISWLKRLNATAAGDNLFLAFVQHYGTHFIQTATFGASYTFQHKMNTSEFERESSRGVDVSVSASYDGIVSVGASGSLSTAQKAAAANFRSKVTTKTITIGSPPPANGDALTWASTVAQNPVPVKYTLRSMEELFTDTFMGPRSSVKDLNLNYGTMRTRVKKIKEKYCKQLLQQGLVDDCSDYISGLTLKETRLGGYSDSYTTKSFSDCVDMCYDLRNCEAVSFCDSCTSSDSDYHKCRVYSAGLVTSAVANSAYTASILLPDMHRTLVLLDTKIAGQERALTTSAPVDTAYKCFQACANDDFCVAFSFCKCPKLKTRCRLFSDTIYGLEPEPNTVAVFVPTKAKANPTPALLGGNPVKGAYCSSDAECPSDRNLRCYENHCTCALHYTYSLSQDQCMLSCSQFDVGRSHFVKGQDQLIIKTAACRPQYCCGHYSMFFQPNFPKSLCQNSCRDDPQCLSYEYIDGKSGQSYDYCYKFSRSMGRCTNVFTGSLASTQNAVVWRMRTCL